MKRIIKAGLMLLLGAAIWTNGGVEKADAQTGGYWEQAQQQQQQQQRQQEQINQQNQMMYSPQYACVNGRDIYGYIGDAACGGGNQQNNNNNSQPVVMKPSSYGAVAWDIKRGLLGTASKQASKQASINAALQKCGAQTCEISMLYSNQCTAVGYGIDKTGKQKYIWQVSAGLTKSKAERAAIADCSEVANNCKIALSECSPAGEIDNAQQYKGLGE